MAHDRAQWARRHEAARAWQPRRIRLLLVSEAPPDDPARDFYFAGDDHGDALFEAVGEVLLERAPGAGDRETALRELRRRGVFVVPLFDGSARARPVADYVTALALRVQDLAPEHVVLIGRATTDAAAKPLAQAGAPVVPVRVSAPSDADPAAFRREFRQALVRAGVEKLIRPLPASKARG